ncbi:unnamed protein product [Soboliphyme baturini]|uniref:L-Fucosyltransferase n=1 Tax=Soboliphyme baturini TaxID=241478 RepID=A0A183IER8_9BILA|nr:unnamed protein product [Soboliphyme baturini]
MLCQSDTSITKILKVYKKQFSVLKKARGLFLIVLLICLFLIYSRFETPIVEKKPNAPCGRIYARCSINLANMMFQYASLYGIAKANNLWPYFECEKTLLYDTFRLSIPRVTSSPKNATFLSEKACCMHDQQMMKLGCGKDYVTDGYLQSWLYFLDYEKELRKEFTFTSEVSHVCSETFAKIRKELNASSDTVAVGVHVRRGDLLEPALVNKGYVAANEAFMRVAIFTAQKVLTEPAKRLIIIIVGQEYQWNMKNVPESPDVYVLSPVSAAVDMCVLSKCNHVIYSVGTYGWWSAFLANGRTFYMKQFCNPGSEMCRITRAEDHFLPQWKPL